jgi:carbamoyl-phosphate synthase large subunit
MYSTYETSSYFVAEEGDYLESESAPEEREKIIILGGGPNRIGQGIEFDYCCCHAAFALSDAGFETIMVNCNPETVSTDYDTSDRLYFEPLTPEDVIELIRAEQQKGTVKGVIVQFGGQTPLKLASALEAADIPILGTSPDAIDLAEDRERFQKLVEELKLKQPENGLARNHAEARKVAEEIGFPVLIRPSYVLGGRAMEIVHDMEGLDKYIREAVQVSGDSPVLIDSYLKDAIEIDVDALCDGSHVFVAGIMQHIEEAGIHSGDSACSLPPHSLSKKILKELERQTRELALALNVIGLMNVQYAIKDDVIYLIEVNPRASRTVPFVAKATGRQVAKIAARLMAGEKLKDFDLKPKANCHIAVKMPVFPFARFPGVDILLGPEMKSTGEVMGIDTTFEMAFAKAQIAASNEFPEEGQVFVSLKDKDKEPFIEPVRDLLAMGYSIIATRGTAFFFKDKGLNVNVINKVMEGRPHIVDAMKNGEIDLMFNTTEGKQSIADSYELRRTALMEKIPYFTTLSGSLVAVEALGALRTRGLEVKTLQSYSK